MAPHDPSPVRPLLLSILMGYGHQRAAYALADGFDVPVERIDEPPLAAPDEVRAWDRSRLTYEVCSRFYRRPVAGLVPRRFLDALTSIRPLTPRGPNPGVTRAVRFQAKLIDRGLGRGVIERMKATGDPMVTTFYTPGLVADYAGLDGAHVVVTDTDVHRVWAPAHGRRTRIHYLVPSRRAIERLITYGVPRERITWTGFPLPPELVGDESADVLRRNLAARLVRLDPAGHDARPLLDELEVEAPGHANGRPPHLVLAVGGAGAQADLADRLLVALGDRVREGRLRITLVAGTRREVAAGFEADLRRTRLEGHAGVGILLRDDFPSYYRAFNDVLAGADVLWTKPSELVFYAGLGIPLILAPPLGGQERYNAVWVLRAGAGLGQGRPEEAGRWLLEMLDSGRLAKAAASGFRHLPHQGTRRIVEAVARPATHPRPARTRAGRLPT